MNQTMHRGPVILVIMLACALAAAGLVRAGSSIAGGAAAHRHDVAAAETPPAAGTATTTGTTTPAPAGHQHGAAAPPAAPGKGERVQGVVTTIVGEVMDPACYLEAGMKSIGPGHFQCAVDCARSGQTLAIYDREDDRIYFIAGELPGKNPNEPLLPYIHKKVDVHGTVYFRSGVYGIVILSVAPHQGAAAPGGRTQGGQAPPAGGKGAGK